MTIQQAASNKENRVFESQDKHIVNKPKKQISPLPFMVPKKKLYKFEHNHLASHRRSEKVSNLENITDISIIIGVLANG